MKIVLDAMGHDKGPAPLVEGVVLALREFPQISKLFLTGDTTELERLLKSHGCNDSRIEIVHSTQVVEMHDSGIDAVRKKKDSSVSRAVDLVKSGAAEAVVSAGNTGAAVAACTIKLRMLPGIERPAIAARMPTETGHFVLCDAGANPDPTPQQLEDNAFMAVTYCEHVLEKPNPKVGLLSNGTEEFKGDTLTLATHALLKNSGLNFHGNVEGHDLFEGTVDVVVADGFTGNVVLKTSEALAKSIFRLLKRELLSNPIRKVGAMICKPAFRAVDAVTNADEYGGSPLLGIDGICIIAHGGSSPRAVKNALRAACSSIQHKLNPHIVEAVQRSHDSTPNAPQPA
ncbi:MAG TPA: phosphate acyltransferase PlsX [Lacipirellulaceae bacterium]|jgi:glycerol-3-phosphate acyltransferase PlsX|nr:phosphate acyltransferase PlsX [Lacipirellulaceae bacterium]